MSADAAGAGGAEPGRCPSCGARVVPGQDWCSLCLQPLGAPPPAATDPVEAPGEVQAQQDEVQAQQEWSDPEPLPPGAAEAMLAELAASTAAERPLARGPLAGTSRGVRVAIGCGASLVLIALVVGLLSLIGLLL